MASLRDIGHYAPMGGLDLYAVLNVSSGATANDLHAAYDQRMTVANSVAERNLIRDAFAVLADPRLRAEYDAGRVVGVGAGVYYERPAGGGAPMLRPLPRPAGEAGRLAARWEARMAQRAPIPVQRVAYSSVARPFFWWLLGVVCGAFATALLVATLSPRS